MPAETTSDINTIARERRLDEEDLQVQFDAVLKSVRRNEFATARAELAGARFVLDGIERRRGGG